MNKDFLDLITGEITNVTRRHEDGDPQFPAVVEGGKLKFEIYLDGKEPFVRWEYDGDFPYGGDMKYPLYNNGSYYHSPLDWKYQDPYWNMTMSPEDGGQFIFSDSDNFNMDVSGRVLPR